MIHIKRSKIIKLGLILVSDSLFFSFTNPQNVKAIFLIVGFVLLVLTLYYLCSALTLGLSWYGLKINHRRRLTLTLTGFLTVILALLSIGQLNLKEGLIITPFFLLLYIYLSYDRLPS